MSWRHANRARSARKRERTATPYDAYHAINKLEQNVVATIMPDFTLEDTKLAFWSDDTVAKLTAAFPVIKPGCRTAFGGEIPIDLGPTEVRCQLSINFQNVGMLCPQEDQAIVRMEHAGGIIRTLTKVHREFVQFNIVRDVVDWINAADNHVTPSAAKYLCPWLPALLPAGHPVTQVDGQKFTLPRNPHPAELMRKAGAVLALAHMAPKMEERKADFVVYFLRKYDVAGSRESEVFGLL